MGPYGQFLSDPRYAHLLRGGMGYPRGGVIQPYGATTLPYQQSAATQIGQAFAEFMSGFAQQQEAAKQQSAQEAMRDMQLMSLGIPIDHKKTVQKMKKAGIDIDTENPAPQVKQNAQAAPGFQMANPMAAGQAPPMQPPVPPGVSPVSVPMNVPMQQPPAQMQMPAYTPTPEQMQAAQPLPQQSKWAQLMQHIGMQAPRVNPNSAPVLALDEMQKQMMQSRAQQQQLQGLQGQNAIDTQMILRGVLHPSSDTQGQAIKIAHSLGIAKREPFDEAYNASGAQAAGVSREQYGAMHLAMTFGADKIRAQVMDMAMKLSPRFDNDLGAAKQYATDMLTTGQSTLKPSMDFDEKVKMQEATNKLQEIYPTIPRSFAQVMAMNDVIGDKKVGQKIQEALSIKDDKTGWFLFPTKGQLDMYDKQANRTIAQERVLQGWRQLGLTAQGQANEMQRHFENAQLSLFGQMRGEKNQQFDNAMKMYYDKNATDEMKKNAMQMAADAMNQMPQMTFKITGANGQQKEVTFNPSKVTASATSEWLFPFFDDPKGYFLKLRADAAANGGKIDTGDTELNKFFKAIMGSDVFKPTQPGGMIGPVGMPSGFSLPSGFGQSAYPNQYELPANPIRQGGVQQFPRGGGGY